jgi:hypothetical protein
MLLPGLPGGQEGAEASPAEDLLVFVPGCGQGTTFHLIDEERGPVMGRHG